MFNHRQYLLQLRFSVIFSIVSSFLKETDLLSTVLSDCLSASLFLLVTNHSPAKSPVLKSVKQLCRCIVTLVVLSLVEQSVIICTKCRKRGQLKSFNIFFLFHHLLRAQLQLYLLLSLLNHPWQQDFLLYLLLQVSTVEYFLR